MAGFNSYESAGSGGFMSGDNKGGKGSDKKVIFAN